ncbi:hypothetical protein ON010_g8736 [Phytophthora cinnamomi]|nr:hypothetical protein ON010_g8736 [Phytophthora cinnamomi]
MNSNFRTRAWDVHKERTNSHRLQKQQERLQQAKSQQQQQPQEAQAADPQVQQQAQPQSHPQQMQPAQGQQRQPMQTQQLQPAQAQQQRQVSQASPGQTQARPKAQSQAMAALASHAQVLTPAPSRQVQGQAPLTPQHVQHSPSPSQTSLRLQNEAQALHQRRQQLQQQQREQRELKETKEPAGDHLQEPARNSSIEQPVSTGSPDAITTGAMSGTNNVQNTSGLMNNAGKRPAPTVPTGAPVPTRRRVFRAGSPGSSMQLLAESEAGRRQNAYAHERHSFAAASAGNHARRAGPSEHAMAMEQADSSARWRHMHDDVSRALSRRRPQGPASYTSGELRAAKTLAQTETGDLGSNNSERVAKKLQSLNAEYQASTMRHADAYNMRHTDVFDRRSAGYKEYWGTLRDVYTPSGAASGGAGNAVSYRKSHHRSSAQAKPTQGESKENEADSTTPDDSGSSEDAFKPAVVVHDASLINAIERLTDATSKQIANLYQRQASDTREALAGLTAVMTDLRVQHGNAFERIIELQEKHLKVMEGILEVKLRKEAAQNAKSGGSSSNGNTSGSSSRGSTSNGASSTTN